MSGPQWHDAAPRTCRSCGGVHDDPTILRELNKRAALREDVATRAAAPTEPVSGSENDAYDMFTDIPRAVPSPDRGAGLREAAEAVDSAWTVTSDGWDYAPELELRLRDLRRALIDSARASAPTEPPCLCKPFFSGHVAKHPDCPRGRAEASAPPSPDRGAGLRAAAAKLAEVSMRLVSRLENQAKIKCIEMDMVRDNVARVDAALIDSEELDVLRAALRGEMGWSDHEVDEFINEDMPRYAARLTDKEPWT